MLTIAFLLVLKAALNKYERWEENIHISILTVFCVFLLFLFEEFCCSGINLITLITRKCYPIVLWNSTLCGFWDTWFISALYRKHVENKREWNNKYPHSLDLTGPTCYQIISVKLKCNSHGTVLLLSTSFYIRSVVKWIFVVRKWYYLLVSSYSVLLVGVFFPLKLPSVRETMLMQIALYGIYLFLCL